MKSLLYLLAAIALPAHAFAQKIDLKVNAGGNLSLLPNFDNQIIIVNGFVIPGVISVNNTANPPMVTTSKSVTKAQPGFYLDVEAGKTFCHSWKISLSLGVSQIRYDYDTHISQSFYKNDFNLSDLTSKYGDTKLTYLTSRPLNVSYSFGKLSLQTGPVVSYLVAKKISNYVVLSNASSGEAIGGFFETKGDAQQFLFGAHLNARLEVAKNLEIMLGSQYYFNSLYQSTGTYQPLRDKSKALQVLLGISYNLSSVL